MVWYLAVRHSHTPIPDIVPRGAKATTMTGTVILTRNPRHENIVLEIRKELEGAVEGDLGEVRFTVYDSHTEHGKAVLVTHFKPLENARHYASVTPGETKRLIALHLLERLAEIRRNDGSPLIKGHDVKLNDEAMRALSTSAGAVEWHKFDDLLKKLRKGPEDPPSSTIPDN